MRLLIAGGGTGGHIYPALAVARSLRARAGSPELDWVGGHRGLEAEIVPEAGIPLRRLALRSLRSAARDVHLVLDPLRLLRLGPAGAASCSPAAARRDLHDRRLRRDPGPRGRRGPAHPERPVGRQRRPGPERPPRRPARDGDRGQQPGDRRRARPAGHVPHRDADPVRRGRRRRRGAGEVRRPARRADPARVRRLAGGPPDQRRRARPRCRRLVERVRVVHVTGDDGYAAALAAREALPEALRDRYRPRAVPPRRRHDRRARRRGPRRGPCRRVDPRRGRRLRAARPRSCPYPHAAGHQRLNAEAFAEAGAAILVEDEELDGDRLVEVAGLLADPAAPRRDVRGGPRAGPARGRGRRRRPRARRRAPRGRSRTPAEIEAVGAAGRAGDAARRRSTPLATGHRHPAPARRQDRPRRGPRRGTRRCASAARPTCSPSPTTRSSCGA